MAIRVNVIAKKENWYIQVYGRRSGVDYVALEAWNKVDMTFHIDGPSHMTRETVTKRTSRDPADHDPILK